MHPVLDTLHVLGKLLSQTRAREVCLQPADEFSSISFHHTACSRRISEIFLKTAQTLIELIRFFLIHVCRRGPGGKGL